jgi:hypothetical protein
MNPEDRSWLQNKLNVGAGELTDDDLRVLLGDSSSSDSDALAGIAFVRTWLSRKALVPLFDVAISEIRSSAVREAAAEAIAHICDESTRTLLVRALLQQKPQK